MDVWVGGGQQDLEDLSVHRQISPSEPTTAGFWLKAVFERLQIAFPLSYQSIKLKSSYVKNNSLWLRS